MRVLLASGIFYPDVGGPATHVRKMAEHFSAIGWDVTVVAFGDAKPDATSYRVVRISRALPKPLSWLLFALAICRYAALSDVVYAFDLTTAGIPAWIATRLTNTRFVIRIGGDPIWERLAEAGKRLMPMNEYYQKGLYKKDKPQLYALICRILAAADRIVVYNEMFKQFYVQYFDVDSSKITVIRNPIPEKQRGSDEIGARTMIFAGRFVAYKNLDRVIRAAARAREKHPTLKLVFVGDGPEKEKLTSLAQELYIPLTIHPKVAQKELFELISTSSVALAPALSEFNPNFILESLSFGKPVAISRDHGLSVDVPEYMQFDPVSVDSMADTFTHLLSDDVYARAVADIAQIDMQWSWRDVLEAQQSLLSSL